MAAVSAPCGLRQTWAYAACAGLTKKAIAAIVSYLITHTDTGWLNVRPARFRAGSDRMPEITPIEPDPDNTGEGNSARLGVRVNLSD